MIKISNICMISQWYFCKNNNQKAWVDVAKSYFAPSWYLTSFMYVLRLAMDLTSNCRSPLRGWGVHLHSFLFPSKLNKGHAVDFLIWRRRDFKIKTRCGKTVFKNKTRIVQTLSHFLPRRHSFYVIRIAPWFKRTQNGVYFIWCNCAWGF